LHCGIYCGSMCKVYLFSEIYYRSRRVRWDCSGVSAWYGSSMWSLFSTCAAPRCWGLPRSRSSLPVPHFDFSRPWIPHYVLFIKAPQQLATFNPHLGYKINFSSNILQVEQILSCFPVFWFPGAYCYSVFNEHQLPLIWS
jgi:hypothetical protein